MAKKPPPKFFVLENTLCIRSPDQVGKYLQVKGVRCTDLHGNAFMLYPTVTDQHLLLASSGKARDIQTVMKIPKNAEFPGIRVPSPCTGYTLETEAFELALEKKKKPRR